MSRIPRSSCPAHEQVNALIAQVGIEKAGLKLGVAALIYTYRCTIACRHCGFGCAANRPAVRMAAAQAVRRLRSLHQLGRVIHVAGGECMMFWEDLRQALAAAQAAGVSPHFIETNCSFAADDDLTRARLDELRALGLRGVLASADPFHQAHVPPEHFLRVRRIGKEVFGPENVWAPHGPDQAIMELPGIARDEVLLRQHVRRRPPLMVGTAHSELYHFLDEYPLDQMPLEAGWRIRYCTPECRTDFARETIWEIHVDPYENIMTNCGVILGKADKVAPLEVLRRGPENANEIAFLLATQGPVALARLACERHGFVVPERARTKCGLCYAVRRFLRPFYPDILGPAEIYGG